jgi:hypothetical protein
MRTTLIIMICLALSSCLQIQHYPGSKKSNNEIAIIKGFFLRPSEPGFELALTAYSEVKNGVRGEQKEFEYFLPEIHLLPGRYVIETYCSRNSLYVDLFIDIDVQAGKTYVLRCEGLPHEPHEPGRGRVFVDSVTTNSL